MSVWLDSDEDTLAILEAIDSLSHRTVVSSSQPDSIAVNNIDLANPADHDSLAAFAAGALEITLGKSQPQHSRSWRLATSFAAAFCWMRLEFTQLSHHSNPPEMY